MKSETETEVKIPVTDLDAIFRTLAANGFRQSVARVFEANTLYDTPDASLRRGGMILRLRQAGSIEVITWKGPGTPGPHKSRPELETTVGSAETMGQVFRRLGFLPVFRYEKYRTEFTAGGKAHGTVTVDETPIGNFLELEGPGDWIDETAAKLGFSARHYVLESYGKLYLADCERRGVQPTNMVFASHE
jgi:adenylate cyclase class 2